MKILFVVTNIGKFEGGNRETGLWLGELTHLYHRAKENGCEIVIASPAGGHTPVDPESLKPLMMDKLTKSLWFDPNFREMLQRTKSLKEISNQQFDCIYLTGGHGTMYDFPDNADLQFNLRKQYESNRVVAAICHGVCGLLNVKLSNGRRLIEGKAITGFNWFEESLARRKKEVPFNLEALLKERDALYEKSFVPMTSKVVVDGNLITGQNPFSSQEMAKVVMRQLGLP